MPVDERDLERLAMERGRDAAGTNGRFISVLKNPERLCVRIDLHHEFVAAVGGLEPNYAAAVNVCYSERHRHVGRWMNLLVARLHAAAIVEAFVRYKLRCAGGMIVNKPADLNVRA